MANGRLPCPDITIPPNNTGFSNPNNPTPPPPPNNCSLTCPAPPCFVPFKTLQLQLSGGKDSFGNVFFYDVNYDIAGTGGLTNTTTDTFCGVLYEYMTHSTGPPVLPIPYVTDSLGNSYSVAAVIISETSIDNVFNVTNPPQFPPPLALPSLMGWNLGPHVAANPRQYNTASTANGPAYGDVVGELTYGELFNKVCTTQNTMLKVYVPAVGSAKIPAGGVCMNGGLAIFAYLQLNNNVEYWSAAGCSGLPTATYTFQTLSNTDWTGLPIGPARNGAVDADNQDRH